MVGRAWLASHSRVAGHEMLKRWTERHWQVVNWSSGDAALAVKTVSEVRPKGAEGHRPLGGVGGWEWGEGSVGPAKEQGRGVH